jgi:hypothetical protein
MATKGLERVPSTSFTVKRLASGIVEPHPRYASIDHQQVYIGLLGLPDRQDSKIRAVTVVERTPVVIELPDSDPQ